MKEKDLIRAIHRLLPKSVYHHSNTMASLTTNGIPDVYYDNGCELWVEYKMLRAMPRSKIAKGDYSELQLRWMERRYNNSKHLPHGANVIGVVGLPNRTAVIQRNPTEWREGTATYLAIPFSEVALWVQHFGSPSSGP